MFAHRSLLNNERPDPMGGRCADAARYFAAPAAAKIRSSHSSS